jgi:adenosylmethionine-8-amino-7-oxononanoate aminotransferase
VSCAVALANLAVLDEEGVVDHVATAGPGLGARLESLRDVPIVGDVRGDGFFWAIELVKDPDHPDVRFTPEERGALMRGLVAPRLFEEGLVCRADDRVDPVVQLAPVLTCRDDELDEIETTLRGVLTEASKHLSLQ